jgi:hypothetical protein
VHGADFNSCARRELISTEEIGASSVKSSGSPCGGPRQLTEVATAVPEVPAAAGWIERAA